MNILKILIASILLISVTHANETSEATVDMEKLPPESQREIQQAIDSARQAREVYLRAIVQANERASSRLARHIQVATRRGDLEGALAVQNAITALEGGWIKDEIEAVVDMFGNEIKSGRNELVNKIIGSWNVESKGVFVFNEDGTWGTRWHDFGGTWEVGSDQEINIIANQGNNIPVTMTYDESGDFTISYKNGTFSMVKIKR